MSNRKLNSYDVLMWWGKVLNSCNTEDQFKNALNLWPKVIKLTPCIDDAWCEVVDAARNKLSRIVRKPPLARVISSAGFIREERVYPRTKGRIKHAVFGLTKPIGPPNTKLNGDPL